MLIPNKDKTKWKWNNGPWCDSKDEALRTAEKPTTDAAPRSVMMRDHMPLDLIEEGEK